MTNRELAKYFNISPAAFSLIINRKQGVSEETRARVISELEKMGYSHLLKKETVVTQSKNLCFVIFKKHGQILDMQPFFLLLIEHMEQRIRRYGYNMVMMTIDKRQPLEEQIQHLNEMDVQGAIIFSTEMTEEDIACFHDFGKPFIIADNDFGTIPINTVSINNEMGTYQAIEYLVTMGHKTIGYLRGANRINSFVEREKGYKSALERLGLELKEEYIYTLGHSEEKSYQDFIGIIRATEKVKLPTAFVSDDDTISIGVLRALKESGYLIPDDISIVGYNDRPSSEITSPALTTISVSKYSFAVEVVDALVGIINSREDMNENLRTKKIRIDTRLLVRDSVKKLN
jgi:LacI family transcriptional regulator